MNKYLFFFLLILITKSVFPNDNPYIRHYGISDGLLTNTVYHISQDTEGFIWFSTDAGAVKYNGTLFQNFRKRDGLTDKEILRTQEDTRGRVWIFSFNANIHFYYKNKIFNKTNTDYLTKIDSREFIIGFYEDAGKTLYFYTSHGLIYSLDSTDNVEKRQFSSLGRLYYITTTTGGQILYVTQKGFFTASSFDSEPVLVMPIDIQNVFDAKGSQFLVWTWSGQIIRFNHEAQLSSFENPTGSNKLITAYTDQSGLLWIGTFDRGVFCLKENRIFISLLIVQPQMIIEDAWNNIWITSMKEGVYKIHPGFTSINHFPVSTFEGGGITSMFPKEDNEVWISNGNSVYYYSNGKINLFYSGIENFSIDLLADFDGELIFGKRNDAVYAVKINPGSGEVKSGERRLFNPFIKGFAINNNKDEFCLHHINDLFIYKKGNPLHPEILAGNERIYSTTYDRKNQLLINSNTVISVVKKESPEIYPELEVFYGKRIDDHAVISDNAEVFNIEGDTLWLVTNKGFINLTERFTFSIDHPVIRLLYHWPYLYFTTRNQVNRIEIPANYTAFKEIGVQVIPVVFHSINDILFQKDTLFVASEDGLTLIIPDEFDKARKNAPKPYFTNVQDREKKLNFSGEAAIILRGNNSLHFDFDAINFTSSATIFSYKLEGLEKTWNTGKETSVVYKNLSPQSYIFKLRAGSFGSEWSEEVDLKVLIKPALYQRRAFIAVCVILVIVLIYFLSIYYIDRLKKSQELKGKLITYEQKTLQSMMNPHFIFNSLGSIQNYLLQNKANEASLYLSQFARLIRQNLNSANSAFISIEDETDRLMNYLSLEKLRLDDKFDFHIKVDEELNSDEVVIPSMVIQPFVENAVWHGISPMNDKGQINISINRESEKTLIVTVEDNGIGMKQSGQFFTRHDHVSIGMETTQKRLNLICKQHKLKFEIQFGEVNPGQSSPGTRVNFIIPYKDNPE